jgi:hypothetical protein
MAIVKETFPLNGADCPFPCEAAERTLSATILRQQSPVASRAKLALRPVFTLFGTINKLLIIINNW